MDGKMTTHDDAAAIARTLSVEEVGVLRIIGNISHKYDNHDPIVEMLEKRNLLSHDYDEEYGDKFHTITYLGKRVLSALASAPVAGKPVRGVDPEARQRVIEIVCDRLTSRFVDWLGEEIAEDLLIEYYDGFLVTQLVSDIKVGVGQWATRTLNDEKLHDFVYDLCEEYLEGEDDDDGY